MKSLKQLTTLITTAVAICSLLLCASILKLRQANEKLAEVQTQRHQSYLLADELRQSSDDLTRLARTYVVSGDPVWEQQYFEVLDIRNGKKPRPSQYERIYWDFRAAGTEPARGPGQAVPLAKLMEQAGFTQAEFDKLKEAQGNSDDLVKTETIAMNLVKGQFEDGAGGFTKKGEPDLEKARQLMHDKNYHLFKAKIMRPVDEFLGLLDSQAGATMTEVVAAIKRVTDIMGEISTASEEQSSGVALVGDAVTEMDRATQQNAALVEESAAAAESLRGQARQLVDAVSVFRFAP